MKGGIELGGYYLLGRLATGGMAEVYLGKSLSPGADDRLLAVKKLLPRLLDDPNFVSMFIDEARIVGGLSHTNICRIFDQGQHEDQLFIVMEFIHGKDLREIMRRARRRGERIPPRIVAHVVATIAEALHYAHDAVNEMGHPENIIHRDVSPQNILVSYDGIPKLIDFGVAKAKHRLAQTRVGVVKGNFSYMSPEQATGQEVDARTDIFALGVILYELLTGRLPFAGSSNFSTLKRIACAEYIPTRAVNANVPQRLATVIETALQQDPANRFATAAEMAAELHSHLADEPREITPTLLSSYLRRLFRDNYIREVAQVKAFLDTAPPAKAIAAAHGGLPFDSRHPSNATTDLEMITMNSSEFSAADYDDDPPWGEGPIADDAGAAKSNSAIERLRSDTHEVDTAVLLAADAIAANTGKERRDCHANRTTTPFEWLLDPQEDTEHSGPAPADLDLETDPFDPPHADHHLATFFAETEEFRLIESNPRGIPTEELPALHAEEEKSAAPDEPLPIHDVPTRELGDGEIQSIQNAALSLEEENNHLAEALELPGEGSSDHSDDEIEIDIEVDLSEVADTHDSPAEATNDPAISATAAEAGAAVAEAGAAVAEEEPSVAEEEPSVAEEEPPVAEEEPPVAEKELPVAEEEPPVAEEEPTVAPLAPRRRVLFTGSEVALLLLAAVLGAALVAGAVFYASTMPIAAPEPAAPAAAATAPG